MKNTMNFNKKLGTRSEMINSVNNNFKFSEGWLSGFIQSDGSFYLNFEKKKTGLFSYKKILGSIEGKFSSNYLITNCSVNKKWFSTCTKSICCSKVLANQYVTGFSDGESNFSVSLYKDSGLKIGWRVKLSFQISLHIKDKALLEQRKSYFSDVGFIFFKNEIAMYVVNSVEDLNKEIIPHFNKYPLLTQKRADFEFFKKVLEIVNNKEHRTYEGLIKILSIKASMNRGNLSDSLQTAFPNIVPIKRSIIEPPVYIDPNWLVGFTDAEGTFYAEIYKSQSAIGFTVRLNFKLAQHSKDEKLMTSLSKYFNCGVYYSSPTGKFGEFTVKKFSDITDKIIPFFNKYPLQGAKGLDYKDFCVIANLIKNKVHLTVLGLEQIKEITWRAKMNLKRYSLSNKVGDIISTKLTEKDLKDIEPGLASPKEGPLKGANFVTEQHKTIGIDPQGKRSYTSLSVKHSMSALPMRFTEEWISGYIQSVGHFSVSFTMKKKNNKNKNIRPRPVLSLSQDLSELEMMKNLQKYLSICAGREGVGYIKTDKNNVHLIIVSLDDLNNFIFPILERHPLKYGKLKAYMIFKHIVECMLKKEHLELKGLLDIVYTSFLLNPETKRRTDESKTNLLEFLKSKHGKLPSNPSLFDPDAVLKQALTKYNSPITLDFLAGLIDGDGSFNVAFQIKPHKRVRVNFTVVQESSCREVLNELKTFFVCGNVYDLPSNASRFQVESVDILLNDIKPVLDKLKLNTYKSEMYLIAMQVCEMIKLKGYKSNDTFKEIIELAYNSNKSGKRRRISKEELLAKLEKQES